nr:MAG TPA: hypothetical protein [Caudoviricetes sp.]
MKVTSYNLMKKRKRVYTQRSGKLRNGGYKNT